MYQISKRMEALLYITAGLSGRGETFSMCLKCNYCKPREAEGTANRTFTEEN